MDLPIGAEPSLPAKPKRPFFTCLDCFIAVGCLLVLIMMIVPNLLPAHPQGQLTACESNLKNISTALAMYASDNQGSYPRSLDQLPQGMYLKTIPTCPAAGKVTYLNYVVTTTPDNFSISCCGNYHAKCFVGVPGDSTNVPSYSGDRGILERPAL